MTQNEESEPELSIRFGLNDNPFILSHDSGENSINVLFAV